MNLRIFYFKKKTSIPQPIGSMGLVYLHTSTMKNEPFMKAFIYLNPMGPQQLPSIRPTNPHQLNEPSSNLIGILQPGRFAQFFGGASVVGLGISVRHHWWWLEIPAISQGHDASFFWMGTIPFFVGVYKKTKLLIKFVVSKKKMTSNNLRDFRTSTIWSLQDFVETSCGWQQLQPLRCSHPQARQ